VLAGFLPDVSIAQVTGFASRPKRESAYSSKATIPKPSPRSRGINAVRKPIAVVLSFAENLKARGIPIAVATNAEREVAEISLTTTGARRLFDLLVSISDGVAPKPAPEMFILAAEHLGHPRNKALVIEDSLQGVEAALEAGMSVVQLV